MSQAFDASRSLTTLVEMNRKVSNDRTLSLICIVASPTARFNAHSGGFILQHFTTFGQIGCRRHHSARRKLYVRMEEFVYCGQLEFIGAINASIHTNQG